MLGGRRKAGYLFVQPNKAENYVDKDTGQTKEEGIKATMLELAHTLLSTLLTSPAVFLAQSGQEPETNDVTA